MADQVGSGTVAGTPPEAGGLGEATPATGPVGEPFHGKAVSWVAVAIIVVGFLVGGLALIFGPDWVLFWAGTGIAVVGGLFALSTGILNDWY